MQIGRRRRQGEAFTTRIRNVISTYSCENVGETGFIAIQEFLANADDAGASQFCVVWDQRTHGSKSLVSKGMREWQGPSLTFYNNSTFTREDWENFEDVGESPKIDEPDKIGQFGLGSLTGYFITDVIQILSGDQLVIVDPHTTYLDGDTKSGNNMLHIDLCGSDINAVESGSLDDHLSTFTNIFSAGETGEKTTSGLEGTAFRLPFRSRATAARSKISQRCVQIEEVQQLLNKFEEMAMELILFTRHVESLYGYIIDAAGDKLLTTSVQKESSSHRHFVHRAPVSIREVTCKMYRDANQGEEHKYLVVASAIKDITSEEAALLDDNKNVEIAACLSCSKGGKTTEFPPLSPEGLLYYTLPMVFRETKLPVHINAQFKIQSDRRSLLSDVEDGRDDGKTDYNRNLSMLAIGPLWASLIDIIVQHTATTNCWRDVLDRIWPPENYGELYPRPLECAARSAITTCISGNFSVLFTDAEGGKVIPIHEAVFLGNEVPACVIAAGLRVGVPIVKPPQRVIQHLEAHESASPKYLTPSMMRQALKGRNVVDNNIVESLEDLLTYLFADGDFTEAKDIQLALDLCSLHWEEDKVTILKLWEVLGSWEEKGLSWRPHFDQSKLVPIQSENGTETLSIEECRTRKAILPGKFYGLDSGVEKVLKAFGAAVACTIDNAVPWCIAFDKLEGPANVILYSLRNFQTSEKRANKILESCPQEFWRMVDHLKGIPKQLLETLPIFEAVNGGVVVPRGIGVIPTLFDKIEYTERLTLKHQYLKCQTGSPLQQHLVAMLSSPRSLSPSEFFLGEILPQLELGQQPNMEKARLLNGIFDEWKLWDKPTQEEKVELGKRSLVFDPSDGTFARPSTYVSGGVSSLLVGQQSCGIKVLHNVYSWRAILFLRDIGLHTNLDLDIISKCLECISAMDESSRSQHANEILRVLVAAKRLAVSDDSHQMPAQGRHGIKSLLRQCPIPVARLSASREVGCSWYRKQKWVRIEEGMDYDKMSLAASSCPILHEELGDLSELRNVLDVKHQPDTLCVLDHLINLGKPGGLYDQWKKNGEALRELQEDCREIWQHLDSEAQPWDVVKRLQNRECVYVTSHLALDSGNFVKVSDLSYDQKQDTGSAPFPIPQYMANLNLTGVLRQLGASKFAWDFLDKIGFKDVRESDDDCWNNIDTDSGVVDLILRGVDEVAPTPWLKETLFKRLDKDGVQWRNNLVKYLGNNCCCQHAKRLAALPLFETTDGEAVAPMQTKVCLIPAKFNSQDCVHALLKSKRFRVLCNSTIGQKRLIQKIPDSMFKQDTKDFFQEWLLPAIAERSSEVSIEDCISQLNEVFDDLWRMTPMEDLNSFKNEEIVMDPETGSLHLASEFLSPESSLFCSLFSRPTGLRILPSEYHEGGSIRFLRQVGLHAQLNPEVLPHCLQRVQDMSIPGREGRLDDIMTVLSYAISISQDLDTSTRSLLAEEIFPAMRLGEGSRGARRWVSLREAADYDDALAVYPWFPVLHKALGSTLSLRASLRICPSLDVRKVVRNIQELARNHHSFNTMCHEGQEMKLGDIVFKSWEFLSVEFLHDACFRKEAVTLLREEPCVMLPSSSRFVKPYLLSYDQKMEAENPPFPVPKYLRGEASEQLLKALGVTGCRDRAPQIVEIKGTPASKNISEKLVAIFNQEENADVKVIVRRGHIFAHRIILKLVSPFFEAYLSRKWSTPNGIKEVHLDEYEYDTVHALLHYWYGGRLEFPKDCDSVVDLLKLSDYCGDEYLKTRCEEWINESLLTLHTCCDLLVAAHNSNANQLRDICTELLRDNQENESIGRKRLEEVKRDLNLEF